MYKCNFKNFIKKKQKNVLTGVLLIGTAKLYVQFFRPK